MSERYDRENEHRNVRRYEMADDEERAAARRKRREAARRERERKIRRIKLIGAAIVALIVIIIVIIAVSAGSKKKNNAADNTSNANSVTSEAVNESGTEESGVEAAPTEPAKIESVKDAVNAATQKVSGSGEISSDELVAEAEKMSAMYDYDSAIELLTNAYEQKPEYQQYIDKYNEQKASCVPVNVEEVPHIFFHSLINDDRGFRADICGDFQAKDNGCWMCSTEEFNTIIQQMYDDGYVMVSLHDLVTKTEDADGNVTFAPNESLMLPPGKKAFVFSEDDLSYYHAYDGQGIASKLILDENGELKNEFITKEGETVVGDYDVVPLINTFVKEHPDFSYRGAKVMIALTGYNGVFGYRTDSVYYTRDEERLDDNQREFLEANPDFNYDNEVVEAKKIAEALKADGFEFASHTWGHRHADTASVESLMQDNDRWVESVEPIVGDVDTIIFAHGSDISTAAPYTSENEKYVYYKNAGYDFFCNVDGSVPYWLQIGDGYVRSGRINIDGYFLYKAMEGNEGANTVLNYLGIHDVESFFDKDRITPVVIPE